MSQGQTQLQSYTPSTRDHSITRTIVVKLETSRRKRQRVETAIERWQRMAGRFADLLPSHIPYRWGDVQESWMQGVARRAFPTDSIDLRAHERDQALYKVSEAFGSWQERGCVGERPTFGDGGFMRLCHCGVEVRENQQGYGIKASLEPYKPEWFGADIGAYQAEWLAEVVTGNGGVGASELHLRDGELYAHLTISTDVEVHEADEVSRWLGVDLGERALYAAALCSSNGVEQVDVESGRQFRHTRERLKDKRDRAQEQGEADAIADERQRYTDQVCHRATRALVKICERHQPCGLRVEDLTHYRETAEDPIHDWPYHKLRTQLSYKALEAGVPVEAIDPRHSSTTCRQCGARSPPSRDGDEWDCLKCGYQVHADVNAAINIANGGVS
jgi:IS605 OrfB family transposase